MANYKRKKPRTSSNYHKSQVTSRKRLGLVPYVLKHIDYRYEDRLKYWPSWYSWCSTYPRSHDIMNHSRPRRRKEKHLLHMVKKGMDVDNIPWPLEKKPHQYYW